MAITTERTQKIDLVLKTIPVYDGSTSTLNTFISTVNLVHDVLSTINPALDMFENSTVFLSIKSKITGKALESVKDLEIRSWSSLRDTLISNFSDKSNSVTILNSILNIKNIKNPLLFFEAIKGKFNNFQSRLFTENDDQEKRKAITDFVEKLIIAHFITNLNDPFRNNLATRNPKTLNEVEALVKNDLQYLRAEQTNKPALNINNQYPFKQSPNKINFGQNRPLNRPMFNNGNYNNHNNRNNNTNRTAKMPDPEPMSVQTRQNTRPWQRESFNTNEQQGSSQEPETQNFNSVENSFLELGRIEVKENY